MNRLYNKRMHLTVTPLAAARVAPAGDAQRYTDKRSMSRYTITILALLVIPLWPSAAGDQVYAFKGEQYPKDPFVLTASIGRDAARIGDKLKVTYRLSNTTDVAISTCASGWDEYSIVGAE